MNITYCWTSPSGYLAACCAELAKRSGVNATLISWQTTADAPFELQADPRLRQHVIADADRNDYQRIKNLVVESNPDVVFVVGWVHAPYVRLVHDRDLSHVKFVVGADTPIRFDWRQRIARLKIGSLLHTADAICVPGDRGFQVMRYWKVPGAKIHKLLYGVDYDLFAAAAESRWSTTAQWPKKFLYVGRYVPIKGVDVLVEAYQRYRRAVDDPWQLTVCGTGPMRSTFKGGEGIEDLGFVQPTGLGDVFRRAGVFVLPSRLDPWGQVIVEAAAAGLPVIATQTCGAAVEVVRDYHNGLVVPPENVELLAESLVWMHDHFDQLPGMGRASQQIAAAYRAQRWADNQLAIAAQLCGRPRT